MNNDFVKWGKGYLNVSNILSIVEQDKGCTVVFVLGAVVEKQAYPDITADQLAALIEIEQNRKLARRLNFLKAESNEVWKVLFGKEIG